MGLRFVWFSPYFGSVVPACVLLIVGDEGRAEEVKKEGELAAFRTTRGRNRAELEPPRVGQESVSAY